MADHRGRLQVQGRDIDPELSRPWDQEEPRLASAALSDLEGLRIECSPKQREPREPYFVKAKNLIERIRDEDGWHVGDAGDLVASFPTRRRADALGRRVDEEVRSGSAFVPDPESR